MSNFLFSCSVEFPFISPRPPSVFFFFSMFSPGVKSISLGGRLQYIWKIEHYWTYIVIAVNAFTTGKPFWVANLLEVTIGRDFGALKGLIIWGWKIEHFWTNVVISRSYLFFLRGTVVKEAYLVQFNRGVDFH